VSALTRAEGSRELARPGQGARGRERRGPLHSATTLAPLRPPLCPHPCVLTPVCWAWGMRSVDMYFNGHDHIQAVQTNPSAPNTTFITTGSSGKLEAPNLNTAASTVTWGQALYRGYSIVTLYATYVRALLLARQGQLTTSIADH